MQSVPTGIYLHIPFCRIKCPYCDFNTYAGIQDQRPRYMEALKAELRRRLEETQPQPFSPQTVYFGGGTPSLLPPDEIAALLEAVQQHGKPGAPMEVTLEVNPGTVDRARLAAFREAGVNRITIGAQSFQPELLSSLGRGGPCESGTWSIYLFEGHWGCRMASGDHFGNSKHLATNRSRGLNC